ncbi:MAG TPA: PEP-utilizing enzyme, partial [Acidimicrobiia bacterium]
VLAAGRQASASSLPLAVGHGASPGRVSGIVVLSADAAAEADGPVILVRPETSPEDVHGMSVSVGVLTSTGGTVSHAAVVARGWGIPAVVGAGSLVISADAVRDADGRRLFAAGDEITIDGATGEVWLGRPDQNTGTAESAEETLDRLLPHLARLERWADSPAVVAAAGI